MRILAVTLLLAGPLVAGPPSAPSRLAIIRTAPDFALADSDGKEVTLSQFRGKVVFVSFVFTTCSGSCPATTARLAKVQEALARLCGPQGPRAARVDHARSRARYAGQALLLHAPVRSRLRELAILTGPKGDVTKTIAAWGMWARSAANGQLDHPSRVFLVDPRGAWARFTISISCARHGRSRMCNCCSRRRCVPPMDPYGIALIGCGTVGGGVARLLLEHADRLAARAGRRLERFATSWSAIPAGRACSASPPTPDHDAPTPRARRPGRAGSGRSGRRRRLGQASPCSTCSRPASTSSPRTRRSCAARRGGVRRRPAARAGHCLRGSGRRRHPDHRAPCQGLAANQILSLQGILNGTCNYILTEMTEKGRSYADVLAEAQTTGYAEADPTLDVDGTDAAHKLAILAQIAFGAAVPMLPSRARHRQHRPDRHPLRQRARLHDQAAGRGVPRPRPGPDEAGGQLALHVAPVMLRHTRPLALVRHAYNAITVVGEAVGTTLYYGRGAGQMPTASAVVADIIDLAVGRAQQTFRTLRLWSGHNRDIGQRSPQAVPSRYYLRLMVQDRPGVLADVTRALANHRISISSMIQHEGLTAQRATVVPLIIMTHTASTGSFQATLAESTALIA